MTGPKYHKLAAYSFLVVSGLLLVTTAVLEMKITSLPSYTLWASHGFKGAVISYDSNGELVNYDFGSQIFTFPYSLYENYATLVFEALAGLVITALISFLTFPFSMLHSESIFHKLFSKTMKGVAPATSQGESSFNPALSGLRGSASLGVGLDHISHWTPFAIAAFTTTFYVGVPIFLMLSMYLLLGNLKKNYNLKKYFKRRIFRIWPIYYGSLLVLFFVGFVAPNIGITLDQLWGLATFTQYFVNPQEVPNGAATFWTLQIEEVAYLIIPLIALLSYKQKKFLSIVMILAGSFSIISAAAPDAFMMGGLQRITIAACLLPYGLGLFAYTARLSPRLRILAPVGIVSLGAQNLFPGSLNYFTVFFYFICLLGFASFLRYPPKFLGFLTVFGELSYAFYIIHTSFILAFGTIGFLIALPVSFLIEHSLRGKEIRRRLRIAYPRKQPEGAGPNLVPVTVASAHEN